MLMDVHGRRQLRELHRWTFADVGRRTIDDLIIRRSIPGFGLHTVAAVDRLPIILTSGMCPICATATDTSLMTT
ncbi:hypothetical protein FsymDg_1361 [Candidatus Protofrankia datiscae]|uniref:Uncharacterized protein n=1 Tax=Candidatus Protofrankia datiscae TaxID=2716812 RepID=F8B194_9ACTN|nr:hypothetical protein FsymDg_1361 [Candidatus Protofrankia datiscae]